MSKRKAFLLRVSPEVLEAVRRWAEQEMRSVNGQIEFVLRREVRKRGYLRKEGGGPDKRAR